MAADDNPDLAALNGAMSALTALHVSIGIVSEYLSKVERDSNQWHLHFDDHGQFRGVSYRSDSNVVMLASHELCFVSQSDCDWLIKHIDSLWKHYAEADQAIGLLPTRLTERLDRLTGKPWVSYVRRNCLDNVLKWPGESAHQTSYAAKKVRGNVPELLEKAKEYPPYETWADFVKQLYDFGHDLFSIRDAVQPAHNDRPASGGKDVHLDDATIVTAKAMQAYLQTLAGSNTTVSEMIIGSTGPNVTFASDAAEQQREAANSANKAKLFPGGLPTNADIIDLVVRIDAAKGSGKSLRQIALEFLPGNRRKALSLLSQIRRLKREGKIDI